MPNISSLFKAIDNFDLKKVEQYLNAGVNVNKRDSYGRTLLIRALYNDCSNETQEKIVQLLIDRNSEINARDNLRIFPLQLACEAGNVKLVEYLLDKGADPNMQDCIMKRTDEADVEDEEITNTDGEFHTALHFLARISPPTINQLRIAELLLKAGANVNAQNIEFRTALDIARDTKNFKLTRLLKNAGGATGYELRLKQFKKVKKSALKAISEIRKYRRGKLKSWPCMASYLNFLKTYVNYHPYGWKPVYSSIQNIDLTPRMGNLVFANFYTSRKYPWPKFENIPLAPLLQIDLSTIKSKFGQSGQYGKFPYTDGILQVWTATNETSTNEDGLVRIIPKAELLLDQMTDERPELEANKYLSTADFGYGSPNGCGAEITSWQKIVPNFATMPYVDKSILNCNSDSDSEYERTAIEVETGEDTVGSLTMPFACTGGTHLFGVSAYLNLGNSAFENSLSGWQNLFQFDGDGDAKFRISGFGTAIIAWNGEEFKFKWSHY